MSTFIAFLRGINVSGQKLIKMDELTRIFEAAGFSKVSTVLASGNVVFESTSKSPAALGRKIEKVLLSELGYDVTVMLRTMEEIEAMVKADPFKKVKALQATRYVTFLANDPDPKLKLPPFSPKKNVEFVLVGDREIFSISHPMPGGDYANPIVEKCLRVPATTRNWKTVEKIRMRDKG